MLKQPSSLSKLKKLWAEDQTKIWSYCQILGAAVLASMNYLNSVLQSDQFHAVLNEITPPRYVTIGIAIFALITYAAHEHDVS